MKVLCIGNAAYDITTPVETFPKENTKNRCHTRIECGGGPAGNAAYLLGKWGVETYFAGVVGDDLYGHRMIDEFKNIGVNTDYLQVRKDVVTPSSFILANAENGSRTVFTYRPDDVTMEDADIDFEPDIILIDGQEVNFSIKMMEKYPKAIKIIDAGRAKTKILKLCSYVDYLVCSKEFAEKATGISIISNDSLEYVFKKLEGVYHNRVVVTLEETGCAYRNDKGVVEIVPSVKVRAVDSTGAGDIFHGAFTYGISQGWPMEKILTFSNLAGAMSVTRVGGRNSIFTLDEMIEVYNEFK